MPCYRCGARQVDPIRGPSPWKRGVRSGAQVLVCPDCQQGSQWLAELDHCTRCGSEQLARILGETLCRACGKQGGSVESPLAGSATGSVELPEQRVAASGTGAPAGSAVGTGAPAGSAVGADLSAEVADALDRIFHRK
jgi:hypothetical protein